MKKTQYRQYDFIRGISIVLLIITIVIIYMVNRRIPFMMDDLWYSTLLYLDEPITSFADIIKAQIWHYNNWGGRSITHGILQLILLAGENAADILNVFAMLILSWMICLISGQKTIPAYTCALGMLLGLNANWKMTMFWEAGAANYLYISIFLLFYLYCYLCRNENSIPGVTLWIVPLGVIAGWSNENMGPSLWIISGLVILEHIRHKKAVKAWMILGNIACLLGSIMVIIAPGNFVRAAQAEDASKGVLWRSFLRGYAESRAAFDYLFLVLLLTAAVLIISRGILKQKIGMCNLLLLIGALLSWGAMIMSPHYPDRACFGTMILLIIVILSTSGKILQKNSELSGMLWGTGVLIWFRGMYFLGEFLALCWGWIQ